MALKGFPFAVTVGNDIAQIARFARYTKESHLFTRWAARTFTRLEWGLLARQCTVISELPVSPDFLYLPVPSALDASNVQDPLARTATATETLARYIAGRWCIKEAVIKAYQGLVGMQDISVGPAHWTESFLPSNSHNTIRGQSYAPVALVEPPRRWVLISEELAERRGLHRVDHFTSQAHVKDQNPAGLKHSCILGTFIKGKFVRTNNHTDQRFYPRRLVWSNELQQEREVAQVSLSHDGGFAVATCIASTTSHAQRAQQNASGRLQKGAIEDAVIDDGQGEAIHEPAWGDEGWVNSLMREQYR